MLLMVTTHSIVEPLHVNRCLALGLTISIASLRVFGNERVVFWREAAPG